MSLVFAKEAGTQPKSTVTATIQKLLDENSQLIQNVVEYQNTGRSVEAVQCQQLLQRNLIYLASLADEAIRQPLLNDLNQSTPQSQPQPALQHSESTRQPSVPTPTVRPVENGNAEATRTQEARVQPPTQPPSTSSGPPSTSVATTIAHTQNGPVSISASEQQRPTQGPPTTSGYGVTPTGYPQQPHYQPVDSQTAATSQQQPQPPQNPPPHSQPGGQQYFQQPNVAYSSGYNPQHQAQQPLYNMSGSQEGPMGVPASYPYHPQQRMAPGYGNPAMGYPMQPGGPQGHPRYGGPPPENGPSNYPYPQQHQQAPLQQPQHVYNPQQPTPASEANAVPPPTSGN